MEIQAMTPDELKAIEKRCEAATEGPWEVEYYEHTNKKFEAWINTKKVQSKVFRDNVGEFTHNHNKENKEDLADMEFMAHARQDIPALLAHIKELQKVVRDCEWPGYDDELGHYCILCHLPKKTGHAENCCIAALNLGEE